jgi:prepilin-type N-terminal cleavage/methylation domain-containing protein
MKTKITARKPLLTKRSAFTMIELVMVIAVLGILASLAIPRFKRDLRQEAADDLLSAIRFTQHLALVDDKQLWNKNKWQQRYWKIMFGTCATGSNNYFYMIGSDDDMNNGSFFDRNESAVDPLSRKPYFWINGQACGNGGDGTVSPDIFISKKYGINGLQTSGGCANVQYIGFDHFGRPHIGFGASISPDYSSYMTRDCNLTFSFSDSSITPLTIMIERQTGHTYLPDNPDM